MANSGRSAVVITVGCLAALSLPLVAVAGIGMFGGGFADDPAALAGAAPGVVPGRATVAYQRAAGRCPGLDWILLAAVGAVESDHGRNRGAALDPTTGEATPLIFGPPLDGAGGTAAIPIGPWAGWWGLTGPWAQAVGPMQFLPATFVGHAVDADDDGITNPHDIDDAAATTAAYLCSASGGTISGPDQVAEIYNPGGPGYADQVANERQRIIVAAESSADDAAANGSAVVCPVAGDVEFTDTFGAARSGDRRHQGVDIFAPVGTPVVAPADGTVEHYDNQLGGLSYRLYADDGSYYYGTHLSAYENVGAGHVTAGTTIGYVGNTGNAATTPPHLHWEIHPAGQGTPATNPTPTSHRLCE